MKPKLLRAAALVARHFAPIIGMPCWNVQASQAGMSLEFGEPRLSIREPITRSDVTEGLRRRRISLRGEWLIMFWACECRYFENDERKGDNFYPKRRERMARAIDGQKLLTVSIDATTARSTFEFDLGGRLETRPCGDAYDQWWLEKPNGSYLKLRGDGCYSYEAGGELEEKTWRRLLP